MAPSKGKGSSRSGGCLPDSAYASRTDPELEGDDAAARQRVWAVERLIQQVWRLLSHSVHRLGEVCQRQCQEPRPKRVVDSHQREFRREGQAPLPYHHPSPVFASFKAGLRRPCPPNALAVVTRVLFRVCVPPRVGASTVRGSRSGGRPSDAGGVSPGADGRDVGTLRWRASLLIAHGCRRSGSLHSNERSPVQPPRYLCPRPAPDLL